MNDFQCSMSGLSGYARPSNIELSNMAIEEMEEEHARLMRRHDGLLGEGKTAQAAELMEKINELVDRIEDMEDWLSHQDKVV